MTVTDIPIAIVGLGKIAMDQHIPSIQASPTFSLTATASPNTSLPDVPSYRDLPDMLAAEPDIAAVALCVPPQVRFELARIAVKAGYHVLLEKPPGASLSEVETLRDLAAEQHLTLFATWHSRFARGVTPAKRWLAERNIGKVTITWREDVRYWHPGQEWIWQAGGLGVFDPGINALSILTEILPSPVHIASADLEFPENRDTPIAARLFMHGPGDMQVEADFDFRQTGPQTWNIEVETTDGQMILSDGGARLIIDGVEQVDGESLQSEYDGIYTRFADLIHQGWSEVDLAPLRHVADAFMLGRRIITDAFHD